jgi:hypothetical protein
MQVNQLDSCVGGCFAKQMKFARFEDRQTTVEFCYDNLAVDLVFETVQIAEEVVSCCENFESIYGKLQGPDHLELSEFVVVLQEVLLLGEDELIEHLILSALEPSVGFEGGGLSHVNIKLYNQHYNA